MATLADGTLVFEFASADPDYEPQSLLIAYRDGVEMGRLGWVRETGWRGQAGRISGVFVEEPFRRQKVATALWVEARRVDANVHHSTTFTNDGRAWAHSLPDGMGAAALVLA